MKFDHVSDSLLRRMKNVEISDPKMQTSIVLTSSLLFFIGSILFSGSESSPITSGSESSPISSESILTKVSESSPISSESILTKVSESSPISSESILTKVSESSPISSESILTKVSESHPIPSDCFCLCRDGSKCQQDVTTENAGSTNYLNKQLS